MEITNVKVKLVGKDGVNVKATASILIEDCFAVKGIKIIQNGKKTIVAMPSRKTKDGEYKDIAHPINSTTREYLDKTILNRFHEIVLEIIKKDIVISNQYYLGYSDLNINEITLFKKGDEVEQRGEELRTFIVEDFASETLIELSHEIREYISTLEK